MSKKDIVCKTGKIHIFEPPCSFLSLYSQNESTNNPEKPSDDVIKIPLAKILKTRLSGPGCSFV